MHTVCSDEGNASRYFSRREARCNDCPSVTARQIAAVLAVLLLVLVAAGTVIASIRRLGSPAAKHALTSCWSRILGAQRNSCASAGGNTLRQTPLPECQSTLNEAAGEGSVGGAVNAPTEQPHHHLPQLQGAINAVRIGTMCGAPPTNRLRRVADASQLRTKASALRIIWSRTGMKVKLKVRWQVTPADLVA